MSMKSIIYNATINTTNHHEISNFSSSVFSRFYEPFDEGINRFIYLLSKVQPMENVVEHGLTIESLELMDGYMGEMDSLYAVAHQHNLLLVKVSSNQLGLMHRVIHKWLFNSCYWDACVSSNTKYVVCLHRTTIRQNLRYANAIVCYNSCSLSHHIYLSILKLSLIVCIIRHCVRHRISHGKNTRLGIRSRRYLLYMNKLNLLRS